MLVITRGEIGGAQHHVLSLCQSLLPRVHFTVVIGESAGSALATQLQALGVRVVELPSLRESMQPWRLYQALQQLVHVVHEHQPDLLHAHSAIAGLITRLAGHMTHTPAIYTVHGFAFKPQAPWLRRHVSQWIERHMIGYTDSMICVSQYERELALLLGLDDHKIHTIPNGIASLPLDSTPSQPTPFAQTDIAIHTQRLIMVARMSAPKRQDLVLRAVALLKQQLGYELPITFVGSGPLLQQHQRLGDELGLEDVTWLGDVDNVNELLTQHDIFVLISDHEGMPLTVLEAMRAGKPIVASDLPGIREQILHSQDGLLCANTPQDVAAEILQLLRDPFLAQRLGQAAQLQFQHAFTVERMAEKVLHVYAQSLSRAHNAQTTSTNDWHALASATSQRRDALHHWSMWGFWLLLPSLWLSAVLQDASLVTYQFSDTLWWSIIPYVVASQLLQRASHLPVAERAGVLWVCTFAPFALTPLGFALIQHPYSRAALLWAYLVTTAWMWWGYRTQVARRALRLVYFDDSVVARLSELLQPSEIEAANVELLAWTADQREPIPACDALVVDELAELTDERAQLLSQLKMQHWRLYSTESVAEMLSGRKILPRAQHSLWAIDNKPEFDRFKRLMDWILVVVFAPLWVSVCALVALAVKFDSPGPVLFVQSRVGRNGQPFYLFKFRSMVHGLPATRVEFAQNNDPRITRVGRFIRRTRLDELPQLFNVLAGQMSLIGPRPEQVPFVREFAATLPSYHYRHLVRPGLTGWAQVQQGYADSVDSTRLKLSYDLYYVEHYSLALDLLIVAKTIRTIVTGFGAR
jgi:lipopolysaccharide/colanic/teichoic acid biosynthesis glycosyltransferase/glycosyltransferase involved in cell wall biosynthesis